MWTHSQSNGKLFIQGNFLTTGYSGIEQGKNNPLLQDVHFVGPTPRGVYDIGEAKDHPTLGPCVMLLTPVQGTNVFGREGLYIHGDNKKHPGEGSHGCLVYGYLYRLLISTSRLRQIEVVI